MSDYEFKNSLFDLNALKRNGSLQADNILACDPRLYEKFMIYRSRTVKHDRTAMSLIFLTGLSAYTSEPINTFLRGESSIGKTYVTIQVLKFFPKEDVWLLGGLSPTALVHDKGELQDKNGNPILSMEKPGKDASEEDKETFRRRMMDARYIVDLTGKILVFLEAPNIETFNKLRPVLSHDEWEISYKFTDKELQARHVVLRGWPAAIFCSTSEAYVQDLATRSFTFTPDSSEEKIKAANKLTGSKAAFPWKFEDNEDFMLLQSYINTFKDRMSQLKVAVPFGEEFGDKFPSRFLRSMRDFAHLKSLVQVKALFYFAQRPILVRCLKHEARKREDLDLTEFETETQTYVLAARQDYDSIMEIWKDVRETTETSAPGHMIKFFHEVVEAEALRKAEQNRDKLFDFTLTVKELTDSWNSKFADRKSSDSIRHWIDFLCDIGWMTKEPNKEDKRENLLRVIKSEKNGNYTESSFSAFFSLQSFKDWLNGDNQIKENDRVFLRENFLTDTEASPEQIYAKYYHAESPQNSFIALDRSQVALPETVKKKTDNQQIVQFPNFQQSVRKEDASSL